jgi:hypothetical protein
MSKTSEFEQHYKTWETSGLSKAGYCKQENLEYAWFIYHCQRMKKSEQGFSQVKINSKTKNISGSTGIEYHFADGSYFVFPADCSTQVIRSLIG